MNLRKSLESLIDTITDLSQWIVKQFGDVLYRLTAGRSNTVKAEYLPDTADEYREYKSKYGVVPGQLHDLSGLGTVVVTDVTGPPDISAEVTVEKVPSGERHTLGLIDFYRRDGGDVRQSFT